MVFKEQQSKPRTIRFGAELDSRIVAAALEDSRTYSSEMRELVKLGLKRRSHADAADIRGKGGSAAL